MRILRLRAYFYPENVAASHLADDMNELYEKEGVVTVTYTPMPSRGLSKEERKKYKKRKHEFVRNGSIEVFRFSMFKEGKNPIVRALRYLCCNVIEYTKGIKVTDIDLVHSSSTPPTQGMLSAMVANKLSKKYGRKVPFVFNLQDVFPDSLVNAGMTKEGSLLWKIGRKIEDYTYKNAEKIIVIGESVKKNIVAKGVPEEKIEIVPNWVDTDSVAPVASEDNKLYEELGIDKTKIHIVYAGNLGEMQGAEVIVEAAKLLEGQKEIEFIIFGAGSRAGNIKEACEGMTNIKFFDLLPQDRVAEVYSLGDMNLITCKKGTGTAGLPSKTWSIMACGRPIIAAFDMDSELGQVLNSSGGGICVQPEDANALAEAIIELKDKIDMFDANNIRQYVIDVASKKVCTEKYLRILRDSAEGKKEIY